MQSLNTWSRYIEHIENALGEDALGDGGRADISDIVLAVLRTVSRWIPEIDARLRGLPTEVTSVLAKPSTEEGVLDVEAAARSLAPEVRLTEGQTLELVLVVLRSTDDALDEEGKQHFRRNLPDHVVESFQRSSRTRSRGRAGEGRSLADGRPGSRRSVADHDVAETDSPARTTEPHSDSKLSTSKGYTQERKRRTLADGKPGSSRPLSDGKKS